MIVHPHPNPVAFEVFGFGVHWYGLMYLLGFAIAWGIAARQVRARHFAAIDHIGLDNVIAAAAFGVIIGGRLGYVVFYKPAFYFENPLAVLQVWEGGMSFHGGLIGVIVGLWMLARFSQRRIPELARERHLFLRVVDFAALLTPPGLGLGRLGNFINAELPGRVSDANLPWLFNFGYPDNEPRHPSQLYQLMVEGVLLMALMLWLARRPRASGWLAGAFVLAYAVGRFGVEFFREPDGHLGLLALNLSAGQWLSIPMMFVGLALLYRERLEKFVATAPSRWQAYRQRQQVRAEAKAAAREEEAAAAAQAAALEMTDEDDVYEDDEDLDESPVIAKTANQSRIIKSEREERGFWSRLFDASDEDLVAPVTSAGTLSRREKRRLRKKKL